jgi:hypothetical protein
MQNSIQSKRFIIRKSLINQNAIIEVTFKNGKTFKYNHDKAYELMSSNLEHLACWLKYNSYTSSTSVPKVLQNTEVL